MGRAGLVLLALVVGCSRSDREMARARELRAAEAMWCGLYADVVGRLDSLADASAVRPVADSVVAAYADSITVVYRRCHEAELASSAFLRDSSSSR